MPAAPPPARSTPTRLVLATAAAALGVAAGAAGPAARAQEPTPPGPPKHVAAPPAQPTQDVDSATVNATAATASQTDPRPSLRAARRTSPITIDGRLDEAAWAAATPVRNLRQQQPDEGRAPSERTEVRVLYDEGALYIGARMYDRQTPRAVLARRDAFLNDNSGALSAGSDRFTVVLDPFRDGNTRVWFGINPSGVREDQLNGDPSWDPIWQAATRVDSLGWTAEIRIPLSQLRFPRVAPSGEGGDLGQTWGVQFYRGISRRNETDMWAFARRNESGGPRYYGTVTGLAVGAQPRQVELVPYAVTGDKFAAVPSGDPFHRTQQRTARVGADVKVLLTPSLTLDATLNPDFGQVEVDPATVNLTAYETYFQEKRPFFIANASYFNFGDTNCNVCSNTPAADVFYSRRIGRAPQLVGDVSSGAAYVDAPDATTILGAAKVTGRTASGWTVGVLDALTGRATARYVPAAADGAAPNADAPVLSRAVEPLTNYFLGHVGRDLRGGDTRLGGLFALTTRSLGDSLLRADLRSRAAVAGVDLTHYWHQRTYSLLAHAIVSDVAGDTAAVRGTEEASARYFQRPDRRVRSDGLFAAAYDPARRSLGGYSLYARAAKENGNWLWEAQERVRSPGYELNDLGFLTRTDYRLTSANLGRQWTTPGRWYRSIFAMVGPQIGYNFDGDRTEGVVQGYSQVQFLNYWSASVYAQHRPDHLDDRLTRGGPVVRRFGDDLANVNLSSDGRRAVVYNLAFGRTRYLGGPGLTHDLSGGVTFKPSSRVLVSLSPSYERDRNPQQYLTTVADSAAPAGFFGRRYVFGTVDQRTLALETRVNTTFTPNLTLELYAQPFLASGAYRDFREFAAPRTAAMRVYGGDFGTACRDASGNVTLDPAAAVGAACPAAGAAASTTAFGIGTPDFNYRSLRGTAVLRWEYRPGSTIFAVWTQERTGSATFGDFDLSRDRAALFRDRPINVFQLKATYWIGR